jgi:protein involved in polysaccharide export with SLBB domain
LRDPIINIAAKELDKPSFIAAGHLAKPGKYALGSETNITEAIAIAGGFTDQSQRSQVVLFSRVDEHTFKATIYDMKKRLANRDLGENGWLEPGDIVYVPQNRLSKIMRFIPSQNIGAYINPIP